MVVNLLFLQLEQDYGPQILGIVGTILGTVIGWLLHFISDNIAKTHITVENFEEQKNKNNEYACIFKIYIFNDSRKQQCIRNLRLLFVGRNRKTLFESRPSEGKCVFGTVKTKKNEKVSFTAHINCYAQSEYIISDYINGENFGKLMNARKIYLLYSNRKNRSKKIKVLSKFDLNNVPISEHVKFL